MKVKFIPCISNDPIKTVEVPDNPDLNVLREMQRLVGGYVEQVNTNTLRFQGNVMLVDEEGLIKGKRANYRAMSISGYAGAIAGDAVICGLESDEEGGHWADVRG